MLKEYSDISWNGLWKQNAGLVQLLGLCPILAVTSTVVNGVSLGLATTLVMAFSNGAVASVRHWVPHEIRIPVFILIISVLVTVIQLAMNAYLHQLYLVLGIFVPLIVTNCVVLARTETFASKNRPLPAMIDGLMMGIGLTFVLFVLSGMRELVGKGTLFSGMDLVFGVAAKDYVVQLSENYQGFLLAILPPGAFIGLGLMIAAKNWIDSRADVRRSVKKPQPVFST